MSDHQSTIISQSLHRSGRSASSDSDLLESRFSNRPRSLAPIYTLNDDVLLRIFDLYRPPEPDDDGDGNRGLSLNWLRQGWWYKLAHVCRLWRSLILASPSRLDLNLVCTYRVPVAKMLAHSPPFPITIYFEDQDSKMTAQNEAGIALALSHRDRVHRICVWMPNNPNLSKFLKTMNGRFPILECMYLQSSTEEVLPAAFQAPNLRRLRLATAYLPIASPLLITATGLVNLELFDIPASVYFSPSHLLAWLPFMPQLEVLAVGFRCPVPDHSVGWKFSYTLDMPKVTLSNLRYFQFEGTSGQFEDLVAWISAPSLRSIHVCLFYQPPIQVTVPHLLTFIQSSSSERFKFNAVDLRFKDFGVAVSLDTALGGETPVFLQVICRPFEWQVASAVQILDPLKPILSFMEKVTLSRRKHSQVESSERDNDVDRTQWRDLLRPFSNATTLRVQDELVARISWSLQSEDEELPLGLLPNLQEIRYSGDSRDAFTAFVNERQVAGHHVNPIWEDNMFWTKFLFQELDEDLNQNVWGV